MLDEETLKAAQSHVEWLALRIEGLPLPVSDRDRLAAGCFHQALEHHEAIVKLVRRKLVGSAFALLRPLFELFVRGERVPQIQTAR